MSAQRSQRLDSNARRGRKPTFRAHVDAWMTHRYWHNQRTRKANPKEPPGVPTTPARGLARAHPPAVKKDHGPTLGEVHDTPTGTTSQGMQEETAAQPGGCSGVEESCGGVEGHALAGSCLAG